MKWIKFETNFWDSETAHVLGAKMGDKGVLTYLRLLTSVGKDIQTADDVIHAHDVGWTKSIKDWAFACKTTPRYMEKLIDFLEEMGKIMVVKIAAESRSSDVSGDAVGVLLPEQCSDYCHRTNSRVRSLTRVTVKFKNISEFVEQRALSSRNRKPKSESSGLPTGDPAGTAREDKIREDKNPPLPPKLVAKIGALPNPGRRVSEMSDAEFQVRKDQMKRELEEHMSKQFAAPITPTPDGSGEGLI